MSKPQFPHIPRRKEVQFPPSPSLHSRHVCVIRITREEKAKVDENPGYLPQGLRYPVPYTEVWAELPKKIGWINYTLYPTARRGHIEVVNVDSEYRRRGLGTRLVDFAIDHMRHEGITEVTASAISPEGLALLKKASFSQMSGKQE